MQPRSEPSRWRGWIIPAAAIAITAVSLVAHSVATAQTVNIAAVVNDEPVSAWDVDQRIKFYQATGAKGSAAALKERSLKELVDELLMRQEARRVGVTVDESQVRDRINAQLQPLKRTYPQFKQFLASRGVRISTLEDRLRAQLNWTNVIRRTYGGLVSISEAEIDEAVEELGSSDESAPEGEILTLQRIVLALPDGADDAAFAKRIEEAEKIRAVFRDCPRLESTLKRFSDVTVTDMPKAKAEDLEEPTRSLALQASAGEMTPPNPTANGVEMIAVCSRSADGGRKEIAQRQLVGQELSMLSDRHLRDLRQDAVIEYR